MSQEAIAIVGLAVRFPGAEDAAAFWRNLREGICSTTFFTPEELRAAGVASAQLADPRYVPANGLLRGAEDFDAEFFGLSPREAELTDPQHRLLLELAWTALEDAGREPSRAGGRTGVFAGTGLSTYLLRHLAPNRALIESAGELAVLLGNSQDFAPTRISHKLDLRGPSLAVNTACSTSLVAVHLACQSLLDFHCDLALAGGASIQVPQARGYLHQAGGIGSPDGRCRAFDARAAGTVGGNGGGLVVLRRLSEALADGDPIRAVILGSAVNNDGAAKVGFTAPGVDGQAQVIAEALAVAGVEPREISYVEAHGTGTELGDPIEVAALNQAFASGGKRQGACALGSVKTNLGHLDEGAGVAGLVKTVLALERRELPPSLHFSEPNPKIPFAEGPFVVQARLGRWDTPAGKPRRAGVSSFGLGGTNAHLVLEEAPAAPPASGAANPRLLVLSARTPAALARAAEALARRLEADPACLLGDVAYTLALGRREFAHRRFVVARSAAEAAARLRDGSAGSDGPLAESGRRWAEGGAIDWAGLFAGEKRRRVPLPTYPFERRGHWVELSAPAEGAAAPPAKRPDRNSWFYQPSWRQSAAPAAQGRLRSVLWLGEPALGAAAAVRLEAAGHRVTQVADPGRTATVEGCEALLRSLAAEGMAPTDIVHAWNAAPADPAEGFEQAQARGYLAVLALVQALGRTGRSGETALTVVASQVADLSGDEPLAPARATLAGLLKVAPQEFPGLVCRLLDPAGATDGAAAIAAEIEAESSDGWVAWRGRRRWVRGFEPLRLASAGGTRLRPRGAYLITGGLGGIGLIVAEHFARAAQARLVLVARRGLPPEEPAAADPFGLAAQAACDGAEPSAAAAYEAFSREADAWCAALAGEYVLAGWPEMAPGTQLGRAELAHRLELKPSFGKFLDYLLGILAEDGWLRREGDTLVALRRPERSAAAREAEAASRHPRHAGILALLAHCARHYPDALSGRIPAIGVLYPEGGGDLLEKAGAGAAGATDKEARIGLLRTMIEGMVAAAGGRRLRILEVGVGDGLLAGRIAPTLRGRNVEYVATDLSRAFVLKAERSAAAAGLDFVSFGVLDIARDPAAQGFAPGSFDAIVALDVVHATPRLAETLAHLRGLLAPGGRLGILEKAKDERWVNLVWGLAEGWWFFADEARRKRVPLLPAAGWEGLLRGEEFRAAAVYPESSAARAAADYVLIVAERSGAEADERAVAAERRAAVRRIEALGGEVVIEEADVADAPALRAVVERAERRFGRIDGAVHAAGLTAGAAVFNFLSNATAEQARALFRPKALGAEVLAEALAGRRLDFCVLVSSNAAVLGGLGLGAYAAANSHLDLLAAEQRRRGEAGWVSANWDGWPTEERRSAGPRVRTSIDQFALSREEAEDALERCLASPAAQVVVSAGELETRLRRWAAAPAPAPAAAGAVEPGAPLHSRPSSAPPYVPPRTPTERAVAALWSELLGVEPVGADDNFFDLEGDSLLGTQLMARVGKDLGVAISMGALFEAPTVAGLAERIERGRAQGDGPRTAGGADVEEGAL